MLQAQQQQLWQAVRLNASEGPQALVHSSLKGTVASTCTKVRTTPTVPSYVQRVHIDCMLVFAGVLLGSTLLG